MTIPFEGGYACGAARYTGTAEPELMFFCHCLACQRESGGPFSVELFIAKDAVTLTGPLNAFESLADSGNKVVRKACPTCNSPIVLEMDGYPDHVCLKAGSLDDAAWLAPQAHIFTASKQPWVRISDDLPQFQGDYEEQ